MDIRRNSYGRNYRPYDSFGNTEQGGGGEAVRTLIRWAGDDPAREGLIETPDRVVRAYENSFRDTIWILRMF